MKLSALYSNQSLIFPLIEFRPGFNVVFARVKNPDARDIDSHNLGKTFLISVIDFALLGGISKSHSFRMHPDIFDEFEFFLEVLTHRGDYVTIRRPVRGRAAISIYVSSEPRTDLAELPDSEWTHSGLSVEKAKEYLDQLVDLSVVHPYPFRKGLGYFLRRQSDYDDVFQIYRFGRGKDREWKPFLAHLLGFDCELIHLKYDLDERIEELKKQLRALEREAQSARTEYDELRGLIEIRQAALSRSRFAVDTFRFKELEESLSNTAVGDIEQAIASLNNRRYVIDYEVLEIDATLARNVPFDLSRVEELYGEAQVVFPDELRRSYEELLAFNERISGGRSERLRTRRLQLIQERASVSQELERLDFERESALAVLREKETLEKYRALQRRLVEEERELEHLRLRLQALDRAGAVQREINDVVEERKRVGAKVQDAVYGENNTYSSIRTTFAAYVERVLNVPALLSVVVNDNGNLEFNVRTLDRSEKSRETGEGSGTSYRKLLCACFDLALLTVYAENGFYHFAYHDGVFEGLDNRKKVSLLDLLRTVCERHDLQHILTVIDSDVPRDARDDKLLFTRDEIIRELHDEGDMGRLFRRPTF